MQRSKSLPRRAMRQSPSSPTESASIQPGGGDGHSPYLEGEPSLHLFDEVDVDVGGIRGRLQRLAKLRANRMVEKPPPKRPDLKVHGALVDAIIDTAASERALRSEFEGALTLQGDRLRELEEERLVGIAPVQIALEAEQRRHLETQQLAQAQQVQIVQLQAAHSEQTEALSLARERLDQLNAQLSDVNSQLVVGREREAGQGAAADSLRRQLDAAQDGAAALRASRQRAAALARRRAMQVISLAICRKYLRSRNQKLRIQYYKEWLLRIEAEENEQYNADQIADARADAKFFQETIEKLISEVEDAQDGEAVVAAAPNVATALAATGEGSTAEASAPAVASVDGAEAQTEQESQTAAPSAEPAGGRKAVAVQRLEALAERQRKLTLKRLEALAERERKLALKRAEEKKRLEEHQKLLKDYEQLKIAHDEMEEQMSFAHDKAILIKIHQQLTGLEGQLLAKKPEGQEVKLHKLISDVDETSKECLKELRRQSTTQEQAEEERKELTAVMFIAHKWRARASRKRLMTQLKKRRAKWDKEIEQEKEEKKEEEKQSKLQLLKGFQLLRMLIRMKKRNDEEAEQEKIALMIEEQGSLTAVQRYRKLWCALVAGIVNNDLPREIGFRAGNKYTKRIDECGGRAKVMAALLLPHAVPRSHSESPGPGNYDVDLSPGKDWQKDALFLLDTVTFLQNPTRKSHSSEKKKTDIESEYLEDVEKAVEAGKEAVDEGKMDFARYLSQLKQHERERQSGVREQSPSHWFDDEVKTETVPEDVLSLLKGSKCLEPKLASSDLEAPTIPIFWAILEWVSNEVDDENQRDDIVSALHARGFARPLIETEATTLPHQTLPGLKYSDSVHTFLQDVDVLYGRKVGGTDDFSPQLAWLNLLSVMTARVEAAHPDANASQQLPGLDTTWGSVQSYPHAAIGVHADVTALKLHGSKPSTPAKAALASPGAGIHSKAQTSSGSLTKAKSTFPLEMAANAAAGAASAAAGAVTGAVTGAAAGAATGAEEGAAAGAAGAAAALASKSTVATAAVGAAGAAGAVMGAVTGAVTGAVAGALTGAAEGAAAGAAGAAAAPTSKSTVGFMPLPLKQLMTKCTGKKNAASILKGFFPKASETSSPSPVQRTLMHVLIEKMSIDSNAPDDERPQESELQRLKMVVIEAIRAAQDMESGQEALRSALNFAVDEYLKAVVDHLEVQKNLESSQAKTIADAMMQKRAALQATSSFKLALTPRPPSPSPSPPSSPPRVRPTTTAPPSPPPSPAQVRPATPTIESTSDVLPAIPPPRDGVPMSPPPGISKRPVQHRQAPTLQSSRLSKTKVAPAPEPELEPKEETEEQMTSSDPPIGGSAGHTRSPDVESNASLRARSPDVESNASGGSGAKKPEPAASESANPSLQRKTGSMMMGSLRNIGASNSGTPRMGNDPDGKRPVNLSRMPGRKNKRVEAGKLATNDQVRKALAEVIRELLGYLEEDKAPVVESSVPGSIVSLEGKPRALAVVQSVRAQKGAIGLRWALEFAHEMYEVAEDLRKRARPYDAGKYVEHGSMMQLAAAALLNPPSATTSTQQEASDLWHDDPLYKPELKSSLLLVLQDPDAYTVLLRQPELLARMQRELTQVEFHDYLVSQWEDAVLMAPHGTYRRVFILTRRFWLLVRALSVFVGNLVLLPFIAFVPQLEPMILRALDDEQDKYFLWARPIYKFGLLNFADVLLTMLVTSLTAELREELNLLTISVLAYAAAMLQHEIRATPLWTFLFNLDNERGGVNTLSIISLSLVIVLNGVSITSKRILRFDERDVDEWTRAHSLIEGLDPFHGGYSLNTNFLANYMIDTFTPWGLAVGVLLLWMRHLRLLYLRREVGPLVYVINKQLSSVRAWGTVVIFFFLAWSSAFTTLFAGHTATSQTYNFVSFREDWYCDMIATPYNHFFWANLALFEGVLTGDTLLRCLRQSPHPVAGLLLMYTFLIVLIIVMLNLLIAMLTQKYDAVFATESEKEIKATTLYLGLVVPQLDVEGMPAPFDLLGVPARLLEMLVKLLKWLHQDVGLSMHNLILQLSKKGRLRRKALRDAMKKREVERKETEKNMRIMDWEKLVNAKLHVLGGQRAKRFLGLLEDQAKQEAKRQVVGAA